MSLADILRTEARAAERDAAVGHKSVINIFLGGGPPHQDMWDIKTEAPSEIRGEFKPIATSVPGIQIGEVFPRIAAQMDKIAVIRSVVGATGGHDALPVHDRLDARLDLRSVGGRPSLGSAVAKLQGAGRSVACRRSSAWRRRPATCRWSDSGKPGFLGPAYGAFKPDGPGMANMTLNGITLEQSRRPPPPARQLRQPAPRESTRPASIQGMDAVHRSGPSTC